MLPVSGTVSRRVARGRLRLTPLALGGHLDSLGCSNGSLTFFTPALPYLKGRLVDDLLTDFLCEHGGEVPFFTFAFSRPVFEGLEDASGHPGWNHALWAVRSEHWDAFSCHMLSLKLTDTANRRLYGVGLQRASVLDPQAMDRYVVIPQEIPLADVWLFGVNGNRSAWAFKVDEARPHLRPRAVRLAPDPQTVRFADAVFAEKSPYDVLEVQPLDDITRRVAEAGGGLRGPLKIRQ